MCTVSYIPLTNAACIAHNRDEKYSRPPALPPTVIHHNGTAMLVPRDTLAGGSWIGTNEKGVSAALLNGAFIAHRPEANYRKSRGLILLDILAARHSADSFHSVDLSGIEPFTLLIVEQGSLLDARWDGEEKFIAEKDPSKAYTWSSVTLYDTIAIEKRASWFNAWLQQTPDPAPASISSYHLEAGEGDPAIDLRMNRANTYLTVSHTLLRVDQHCAVINYTDLRNATEHRADIQFTHTTRLS